MIKKFQILIILSFIICNLTLLSPVYAIESSSSASMSADLKIKLKALQDQIASKASQLKAEVSESLKNKAYVGAIKSKSDTSLTVATRSGSKIITVNEFTQYSITGKNIPKKPNLKNLEADDYIAALGDIDETGVLTARKIIKVTQDKEEEKQVIFGQAITLKNSTITIQNKDGQSTTLSVDDNTSFTSPKGESLDLSDIPLNKTLVAVGLRAKGEVLKARFIYLPNFTTPAKKLP